MVSAAFLSWFGSKYPIQRRSGFVEAADLVGSDFKGGKSEDR